MEEKQLLRNWLISLYASLKDKNKEIESLERSVNYDRNLHEFQANRLSYWMNLDNIDSEIKEELEYSEKVVRNIPNEDERRLSLLIKSKQATLFMIEQVEKELRD